MSSAENKRSVRYDLHVYHCIHTKFKTNVNLTAKYVNDYIIVTTINYSQLVP